jgi:hypothetical protein
MGLGMHVDGVAGVFSRIEWACMKHDSIGRLAAYSPSRVRRWLAALETGMSVALGVELGPWRSQPRLCARETTGGRWRGK